MIFLKKTTGMAKDFSKKCEFSVRMLHSNFIVTKKTTGMAKDFSKLLCFLCTFCKLQAHGTPLSAHFLHTKKRPKITGAWNPPPSKKGNVGKFKSQHIQTIRI